MLEKGTSWILSNISPQKTGAQIFAKHITFKLRFHLEDGLVKQRSFEFFSLHDLYFHPTKDCCSTRLPLPFLQLFEFWSNFLHGNHPFFSVENMGHWGLKKSSKYKLVMKRRFTFANYLLLFIQGSPLTHVCNVMAIYQPWTKSSKFTSYSIRGWELYLLVTQISNNKILVDNERNWQNLHLAGSMSSQQGQGRCKRCAKWWWSLNIYFRKLSKA